MNLIEARTLVDLAEVSCWDTEYATNPLLANKQMLIASSYKAAMLMPPVPANTIIFSDLSCFAMSMLTDNIIERVTFVVGTVCRDFEGLHMDRLKAVRRVGNKFSYLKVYDTIIECIANDMLDSLPVGQLAVRSASKEDWAAAGRNGWPLIK